ncbi:MAG: hypothetical protein KGP28_07815 [Bdellovibrionales bacterium]|nr:hypothetical protein [Bdellovibrionales bacterium]
MFKVQKSDKILTVQVHHENLNPRTFKVPVRWIHRASWMAWLLLSVSLASSLYAVREYYSERSARPELVAELENEVQNLKIALEKKTPSSAPPIPGSASSSPSDPRASDTKPSPAPGIPMEGRDGVWNGLAEQITVPPAGTEPSIRFEDARVEWQGKYANFTLNVVYRNPGKGSQQGHLVALGRSNDSLFAHPDGVLNTSSGSALFDANRGEYFSVARFRVLKARFGPFETNEQLREIQIFAFDLSNKLIKVETYKYGK